LGIQELARVDSHIAALTGKFLVVSVPCALIFTFDNEYSWFREKSITYRITVTPPAKQHIIAGRRKRATSALQCVQNDKAAASQRLDKASSKRNVLREEISRLEKELEEKKKTLGVVQREEEWLKQRLELRGIQEQELEKRLTLGWEDEREEKAGGGTASSDEDHESVAGGGGNERSEM